MMICNENKASRDYDSNLDYKNNAIRTKNFMVGTHGSKSIMLVQQNTIAGKAIGGGVEAGGTTRNKDRNISP